MSRKMAAATAARQGTEAEPAARADREVVEFLRSYEKAFRATARRFSYCEEDAEDALQRSIEILLTRAPEMDRRARIAWMHVVVRHEALRIRRRSRAAAMPAGDSIQLAETESGAFIEGPRPECVDPAEMFERRDELERYRQAFARLKPNERRALGLIGEGYSYREIAELTGWSATKINRLLSEGRGRVRELLGHLDSGRRCAELAGPLSRFSDGEATPREERELRDHLASCMACRATLRSYRLSSGAAALALPLLPASTGRFEGGLQSVASWLQARLAGRGSLVEGMLSLSGGAGAGGGRGGFATLAKLAIVCAGAGGGTAACVATGILPAPSLAAIENIYSEQGDEAERTPAAPVGNEEPAVPAPAPEQVEDAGADPRAGEAADEGTAPARTMEGPPIPEPTPQEAEFGLEAAGSPALPAPRSTAAALSSAGGGSSAAGPGSPAPSTTAPPSGPPTAPTPAETPPSTRPPLAGGGEFGP